MKRQGWYLKYWKMLRKTDGDNSSKILDWVSFRRILVQPVGIQCNIPIIIIPHTKGSQVVHPL